MMVRSPVTVLGSGLSYSLERLMLTSYPETCHVLPLYSFTTPAKYCYRAVSIFVLQYSAI